MTQIISFKCQLLYWVFLFFICQPGQAQQNEKIVFPNPAGFNASEPVQLLPTSDGGWLVLGNVHSPIGEKHLPRALKLNAQAQVEWDQHYLTPTPPQGARIEALNAVEDPDGGWLVSVHDDTTFTDLIRLDAAGNLLWSKNLGNAGADLILARAVQGVGYYAFGRNSQNQLTFKTLNTTGDVTNTLVIPSTNISSPGFRTAVLTSDNNILAYYQRFQNGNNFSFLEWYDLNGNLLNQSANLGLGAAILSPGADGGFLLTTYTQGFQLVYQQYRRYDAAGNLLATGSQNLSPQLADYESVQYTYDQEIALGGRSAANRGVMARLNADLSLEWISEQPDDGQSPVQWLSAVGTADGWALGTGQTLSKEIALVRISANTGVMLKTIEGTVRKDNNDNCVPDADEPGLTGTLVKAIAGSEQFHAFSQPNGHYSMYVPSGVYTLTAYPADDFFFTCPAANGVAVDINTATTATRDFPIQALDLIHEVKGKIVFDVDGNCAIDATDQPMKDRSVQVLQGNFIKTTGYTNLQGEYSIFLPDGDYTIRTSAANMNNEICNGGSFQVSLGGGAAQTVEHDFIQREKFQCALMKTWISGAAVRPCTTATFQVGYYNVGTEPGENVQVQVALDPLLQFVSSNPAPSAINGNVYTYFLGIVNEGQQGVIKIEATPDCNLQIDQQVCISSEITPTTFCAQAPNWNGAVIVMNAQCDPDNNQSVFTIKNIGNAASSTLDYVIVEDQIVLVSGDFQLNPGQSQPIQVPSSSQTQVGMAQQEPGFPGDTSVTVILNGCNGAGMPAGFNFPLGLFSSQNCFGVVNSFDPNDKQAQPQGIGPDQVIWPGSRLDYRIRFQNTGNDTAFLVVLRDTLEATLDPSTIEFRGASHPMRWELLAGHILQVTYEGIQLPDSLTNPEGSQGYFEFEIRHRDNLPLGTLISNRAGIYFDFNPPVITNTVRRKIDKILTVRVKETENATIEVQIVPNPVEDQARVDVSAAAALESRWQWRLYDSAGRLVQQHTGQGTLVPFQRQGLPAGMYHWQVVLEDGREARGKVVLK